METHRFQIPPFSIKVDGYLVDILEVLRRELVTGDVLFFVVVQIHYKGITSRRYTLCVRDEKELENKLKIEITKIKFIELAYGLKEVERLIT